MGEVYEAEDLELHERVALKTVRSDAAGDARAPLRFKREINLARKVTHPNVCRTFDVFRHTTRETDGREITFLSMELLEGETLADRLRRAGPMSTSEAFPLVVQMAAALEAAHKEHIVHRDFKSQNVMLVPPRAGHTEMRAVVTDFGLARLFAADDVSNSTLGDFVGSPPYMAPEQVEGGEVTSAADIYALGVVMYEMVSGAQPFVGETPIATAVKRLREPAPSPRVRVPDLDPKWEAAILRCLERHPADRFSCAREVVEALSGPVVSPGRRARRRREIMAGTALLVIASAAGYRMIVARRNAQVRPPAVTATAPANPGASKQPNDAAVGVRQNANPEKSSRHRIPTQAGVGGATVGVKALNAFAAGLWQQGNLEGARKIFEEASAKLNEGGDQTGGARTLIKIASIFDQQGQLDAAQRKQDEASAVFAAAGDRTGEAQAMDVAVHVLMHRGDLKAALQKNQEETKIYGQIRDQAGLAEAEYDRGLLLREQGDLAGARDSLRQSLAIRSRTGEKQAAADIRASLAELSFDEGRFAEAETSAREAAEELRKAGSRDKQSLALNILARSLVAQGKPAEAQAAIDEAAPVLKNTQNRYVSFEGAIANAQLQAAWGSTSQSNEAEVEQVLTQIIKAAKKDGLLGLEFRGRLALGEIQMKSGNARSGRARLAALERQASGKGFGLIAREAERARHPA
jgi:tetratricopeptide (TPR) repeat protein